MTSNRKFASTLLLFILITTFSFAQDRVVDSLILLLNKSKDTSYVNLANKIAKRCVRTAKYPDAKKYAALAEKKAIELDYTKGLGDNYNIQGSFNVIIGDFKEAVKFYKKAIVFWQKIKNQQGVAASYNNIGEVFRRQQLFDTAMYYYNKALKIRTELKLTKDLSATYQDIGLLCDEKGDFSKALEYYLKGLRIDESSNDKIGMAEAYNNLGLFLTNRKQYDEALNYFNKALNIDIEQKNKLGEANIYTNMGRLYSLIHQPKKAEEYLTKSLHIYKETGANRELASCLVNIGIIYFGIPTEKTKAIDYFERAYTISESINDIGAMAGTLSNIAYIHITMRKYDKAIVTLNKSLVLAKKTGVKELLMGTYSSLVEVYDSTREYKKAFIYQRILAQIKDSVYTTESTAQMAKMQTLFETEKKNQEISLLTKDNETKEVLAKEEKKQKLIILVSSCLVILLVSVFSVFVVSRLRITRKQKKIIEEQKVIVDEAFEKLHEKNKEVMDSIYYARRIQRAVVTSEYYIEKNLRKLNKN